jgi:hypothetical protein
MKVTWRDSSSSPETEERRLHRVLGIVAAIEPLAREDEQRGAAPPQRLLPFRFPVAHPSSTAGSLSVPRE